MHQYFRFGLFTFEEINQVGQFLEGVRIGNRRAKFDVFNAEAGQGQGQFNFLVKGKVGAAKLFALAQGGIQNFDLLDIGASPTGNAARFFRAVNCSTDNRPPLK